jgi:hypothetical protein
MRCGGWWYAQQFVPLCHTCFTVWGEQSWLERRG